MIATQFPFIDLFLGAILAFLPWWCAIVWFCLWTRRRR